MRAPTGANSITGQCNAMGSRLFSNTTSLLGGRDFQNAAHRNPVANILGIDANRIPDKNSLAIIPQNDLDQSRNGLKLPQGRRSQDQKVQIAVFNFSSQGEWYACQNMCPHKASFVLSRGIIGNASETPKVSCPMHKKPFSLQTGESLSGEDFAVKVFPVRSEADEVFLLLPPRGQLDALLATDLHCIRDCSTNKASEPELAVTCHS